jgi:UPF0716 family protein affecting phage T7 exclusion
MMPEPTEITQFIFGQPLRILFWFIRELGWWWTVGVMLAILVDYLGGSRIVAAAMYLGDY